MERVDMLKVFFDYASVYLGRKVDPVTIREGGKVVPKFDELTTDYTKYTHLFVYWGKLALEEMRP